MDDLLAGVELTPEQSNAVIEEKLVHLLPALEGLYAEIRDWVRELTEDRVRWCEMRERAMRY